MKYQSAFSQFELLMVIFIIALLFTFTVPSLQFFWNRTNDHIVQSQLIQAIRYAQQASRAMRLPVALCKSANHAACSNDKSHELLIFIDENKNGVLYDKSQILSVIQLNSKHATLNWRSYPYYRQHYLLFLPTGMKRNDNGTFWYCHEANKLPAWSMVLSQSGKIQVKNPDRNGVIYDSEGEVLRC